MESQVCHFPLYNPQQFAATSFAEQQFDSASSQSSGTNDLKVQGTIKRRNRLKPHQTKILTHSFLINPRPTVEERAELGKTVGMNPREIQVWFQNHRAKIKKEKDSPEEFNSYLPLTFSGNQEQLANWQLNCPSLMGEFLPRDFELKAGSSASTIDSGSGLYDERFYHPIQTQSCTNMPLLANSLNRLNQAFNLYTHRPHIPPENSSEIFQQLPANQYTSYDHKDTSIFSNNQLDNTQTGDVIQYNMYSMTSANPYPHYYYQPSNNLMNQMLAIDTPIQSPFPIQYSQQHDYSSTEATPMPFSQLTPVPYTPSYIQPESIQMYYDECHQTQSSYHMDQKTNASESSPLTSCNSDH